MTAKYIPAPSERERKVKDLSVYMDFFTMSERQPYFPTFITTKAAKEKREIQCSHIFPVTDAKDCL